MHPAGSFTVGTQASCGTWALKSVGFCICGRWAWLLRGTWDLSSQTRAGTHIPSVGRQILNYWTTRKVPRDRLVSLSFPVDEYQDLVTC